MRLRFCTFLCVLMAVALTCGCTQGDRYRDYNEGVAVPDEPPVGGGGGGSGYTSDANSGQDETVADSANTPATSNRSKDTGTSSAEPAAPPTEAQDFD